MKYHFSIPSLCTIILCALELLSALTNLYCWKKKKRMKHVNMYFIYVHVCYGQFQIMQNNQNRVVNVLQKQRWYILFRSTKYFCSIIKTIAKPRGTDTVTSILYSRIIQCSSCFPICILKKWKLGQLGMSFLGQVMLSRNKSNQKDLASIKTTEPCNCPFQKNKIKIPNSSRCPPASFPLSFPLLRSSLSSYSFKVIRCCRQSRTALSWNQWSPPYKNVHPV